MDATDIGAAVTMGWLLAVLVFTVFAILRFRNMRMKFRANIYPYSYYRRRKAHARCRYFLTVAVSVVVAFAVNFIWHASL